MFWRHACLILALLMAGAQGGEALDDWQVDATAQLASQHQCTIVFLDEAKRSYGDGQLAATGHCADGRVFIVERHKGDTHFVLSQVANS